MRRMLNKLVPVTLGELFKINEIFTVTGAVTQGAPFMTEKIITNG